MSEISGLSAQYLIFAGLIISSARKQLHSKVSEIHSCAVVALPTFYTPASRVRENETSC